MSEEFHPREFLVYYSESVSLCIFSHVPIYAAVAAFYINITIRILMYVKSKKIQQEERKIFQKTQIVDATFHSIFVRSLSQ